MTPKVYFIHLKCRGNKIYNMVSENISTLRLGHSSITEHLPRMGGPGFHPQNKTKFLFFFTPERHHLTICRQHVQRHLMNSPVEELTQILIKSP